MNRSIAAVSLTILCLLLASGAISQTSANTPNSTSPQFTQFFRGGASAVGVVRKIATIFVQPSESNSVNENLSKSSTPHPNLAPNSQSINSQTPVVSNPDAIVNNPGAATTAKGVNAYDNFQVNGVDYEPPDQGLCAGNGYVIDVVNTVMKIYTPSFQNLTSAFSPNAIDGLALAAFTSDPRCIFDQSTARWFLTQLYLNLTSPGQGFEYIAVSATPNPLGAWNVYALNVTDSFPRTASYPGQTRDSGCPCFGDQPLLGASRDALAVSTNEYNIFNSTYNGAQFYLFDKLGMALGNDRVSYVHYNALDIPTPDGNCLGSSGLLCWTSVNPAASPTPSQFDNSNNGTEYALSTLDFQYTGDNRLAAWSFTNTRSLRGPDPDVKFSISIASGVEQYTDPLDSLGNGFLTTQKAGPTPAGDTVYSYHPRAPTYGCKGRCPEGLIQTNGDKMFDTVVYSQGELWGGVNTIVSEPGSSGVSAGIAYWVVSAHSSKFSLASQGYVVAGDHENVMFPSIGAGPTGDGVITFTLTGPNYYPSSAYGLINKTSNGLIGHSMNVADLGKSPDDDLSEYQCISGTCNAASGLFYFPRWGDYTWAVWSNGRVYFSTEYIQYPNCDNTQYRVDPTCGATRGPLANWGTSLNSIAT